MASGKADYSVRIVTDAGQAEATVVVVDGISDLSPVAGDSLFFDGTNWVDRPIADGDVPAAIARDSEVTTAVAVEATARSAAVTSEATARSTADTAEATARASAVTAEATTRAAADTAEATARAAADALLLPKAGGTMSGELILPDLSVAGLTGAVAGARLVGGTATGPPTSGTFVIGDYVIDRTGVTWICTVAGTPGTWTAAGGTELGYAESTSDFSTASTSFVDVTSITKTVTVGSRPIKIIIDGSLWSAAAATQTFRLVEDPAGANTALPLRTVSFASILFAAFHAEMRRSPAAGDHTYKLQMKTSASTGHFDGSTASGGPNFIQVVQL